MEMNGGSSAPYLARTPCVLLFSTLFNRDGNRGAFRLPGVGGGSFPLYGGTFARSYSVSISEHFFQGICGLAPRNNFEFMFKEVQGSGVLDPCSWAGVSQLLTCWTSQKANTFLKYIWANGNAQRRKKYTPPLWRPPFFLFLGLRLYGVYPSFRTYGAYPFPLVSQENGIHQSFFCSVTSGSGDRPRKEGSHGGGVYSFFPWCIRHPVLSNAGSAAGARSLVQYRAAEANRPAIGSAAEVQLEVNNLFSTPVALMRPGLKHSEVCAWKSDIVYEVTIGEKMV